MPRLVFLLLVVPVGLLLAGCVPKDRLKPTADSLDCRRERQLAEQHVSELDSSGRYKASLDRVFYSSQYGECLYGIIMTAGFPAVSSPSAISFTTFQINGSRSREIVWERSADNPSTVTEVTAAYYQAVKDLTHPM